MNQRILPWIALAASSLFAAPPNLMPRVPSETPQVPKGLQIVDWKQIKAEYQRHRHGAFPDSQGFHAQGFEQYWMTHFDGRGFWIDPDDKAWRWGLELAGAAGKPVSVTADVNRVTYRWSADLDEWFLNDTRGLEQGFTLHAPRPELRLTVRGGLHARLAGEGGDVEFVDESGAARVKYSGLAAWDATGRALPARMKVESGQLVLTVDDRGARYPVTIDPIITQQAYVKGSNTDTKDQFGQSVAVSGDTVVVGAPGEGSISTGVNGDQTQPANYANTGAAYVFVRSGTTWSQQAYLKASTYTRGVATQFGTAVAIDGDTIVVGSPGESSKATGVNGTPELDNSVTNAGAAYIFFRAGTTWAQQAYLKASNTLANPEGYAYFGQSVSISADTVVVGAPWEGGGSKGVNGDESYHIATSQSGAAYVFVRANSLTGAIGWTQQAYLKASNTVTLAYFGTSVAVTGSSVSGSTVVVGAKGEPSKAQTVNGDQTDTSSPQTGAAYVFFGNPLLVPGALVWTQQAYLKGSNAISQSFFGASVAIDGNTVVVGASGVDNRKSPSSSQTYGAGGAYVFAGNGSYWTQFQYIKAPSITNSAFFGCSVSLSDGTLVVGAYLEPSNATGVNGDETNRAAGGSGAAFVFQLDGTGYYQQGYLKASNTGLNDQFGIAVSVSRSTVAVGANHEASNATGINGNQSDNSALQSGAAYFFDVPVVPVLVKVISFAPSGLTFTSSGTGCAPGSYTTPAIISWTPGSVCSLSFGTPQMGINTQYLFNHWEDGSTNPTRTITVPYAIAMTFTANFDTQYLLTTSLHDPSFGGSITPGGYFAAGTSTTISATPAPGFAFSKFVGSATLTSNPATVVMNAPKFESVEFTPTGAPLLTVAIPSKVDGAYYEERIWTVQVTNTGTGPVVNPRIQNVVLTKVPKAWIGVIYLGSTVYPLAFPATVLNPGQSSSVPISIVFPPLGLATSVTIQFDLVGDFGYKRSVTLTNQKR